MFRKVRKISEKSRRYFRHFTIILCLRAHSLKRQEKFIFKLELAVYPSNPVVRAVDLLICQTESDVRLLKNVCL